MEQLTDEMIVNTIEKNDTMGFVMALVVIFFVGISAFIVFYIGRNKAKEKNKKINLPIIVGIIMMFITIFILFICIKGLATNKDWYLTISTITNKYTEIDSNSGTRNRIYHYIETSNHDKIKVTEEEYDKMEINEDVYVLFVNGHANYVWNIKQYQYTGEKLEIGKTEENINKEESLDIELNINILKNVEMINLDADTKTIELGQLPEEFMFIENLLIPEEYKFENSYTVYTRENKEIEEYNVLHDYLLNYRKDDLSNIKIAFSKIEEPIRDYYILEGDKTSKIGDVELKISQCEKMYIVTFKYKDIYFDIETTGITEEQLVSLLKSIIEKV